MTTWGPWTSVYTIPGHSDGLWAMWSSSYRKQPWEIVSAPILGLLKLSPDLSESSILWLAHLLLPTFVTEKPTNQACFGEGASGTAGCVGIMTVLRIAKCLMPSLLNLGTAPCCLMLTAEGQGHWLSLVRLRQQYLTPQKAYIFQYLTVSPYINKKVSGVF